MLKFVLATPMAVLALLCTSVANGQSAKGAAAGLGKAMNDLSQKYIDQEIELENAKRKADLEFENFKRMREYESAQKAPQGTPATDRDVQRRLMDEKGPRWQTLINSKLYGSWLTTRGEDYRLNCRRTSDAAVLLSCLNDFLSASMEQSVAPAQLSSLASNEADVEWAWDEFRSQRGVLEWECRGMQTGRITSTIDKCRGKLMLDNTWPGPIPPVLR